ncbi:MAG: murein biosynthesis integral membrane protein MurJ [Candidatus Nanopelagicales bacterium]
MSNPASARSLMKPSAVMAAGTVASRITGVFRDIAATAALGFFLVSDAFSLGNSLPTVIYILVIGGALNAVFVPQLVRRMKEDADDGRAYADRLITLVGSLLLVFSILAVLCAPLIVDLYTPDNYPANEYDLAVAFARLCLPQVLFYGIYTMLSQVLNARGRFGAPMFAPIANNIVAIATFLLFIAVAGTSAASDGMLTTDQVLILGIGTTLGVIVQALILIPVLVRSGYRWKPRFDWKGSGLGKTGSLAMWTIGLVFVNQAAYIVITRLAAKANVDAAAAGVVAAGLTTYQKAHLVFMLPHSVITVSIVTAMLPALSRVAHDGNLRKVGNDVGSTMRLVAALIVPIAAILMCVGTGVAILLFGYGAATPEQAGIMGAIVSIFMIGLLPFTLFYVMLRGYYALEDTKTPFWITVGFNVALLAIAVPLFNASRAGGFQVGSLALSYGIAYWIAFIVSWFILGRRLGGLDTKRTVVTLVKIIAAGLISLGVMFATFAFVFERGTRIYERSKLGVLEEVVLISLIGLAVYLLCAWALRVHEVGQAIALVRRKIRR